MNATPWAALVLATGLERDPSRAQRVDDHLESLVATLVLLGASPVVVVHDGTPRVPASARELRLPRASDDARAPRAARDDASALRLGLAQLANAPVGVALIASIEAHALPTDFLRRLVDEAQQGHVPLVATARAGTLGLPIVATRDTWRELLTTDGGVDAVLRQQRAHVFAIEPEG